MNTYTLYDGSTVTEVDVANEYLIVAKNVRGGYYLKITNNDLVDPKAMTTNELKKSASHFFAVEHKVYKMYIDHINNKNNISLRIIRQHMER